MNYVVRLIQAIGRAGKWLSRRSARELVRYTWRSAGIILDVYFFYAFLKWQFEWESWDDVKADFLVSVMKWVSFNDGEAAWRRMNAEYIRMKAVTKGKSFDAIKDRESAMAEVDAVVRDAGILYERNLIEREGMAADAAATAARRLTTDLNTLSNKEYWEAAGVEFKDVRAHGTAVDYNWRPWED